MNYYMLIKFNSALEIPIDLIPCVDGGEGAAISGSH
jgi:hypothetical protein